MQPVSTKPVVCLRLGDIPLPTCQVCLSPIEEGESMVFWGLTQTGKKLWVHWTCWKEQKREAEEHDRFIEANKGVSLASTTENPDGGMPVAGRELQPRQDDRDELRAELIIATNQAYDIEAHVGSLLASLRILAAKVSK